MIGSPNPTLTPANPQVTICIDTYYVEQYNLDTIAETTNTSGSGGGHYRGQRDATSVDWILYS